MSDLLALASSLALGLALGIVYFGGLWLTLRILFSQSSSHGLPAIVMLSSFTVRSCVCLFGFYLIAPGGLDFLASCLAGFVIVKAAAVHWWRPHASPDADMHGTGRQI
jgi:F1F0 ATPase subunit 2